jgi:hypothetical protein
LKGFYLIDFHELVGEWIDVIQNSKVKVHNHNNHNRTLIAVFDFWVNWLNLQVLETKANVIFLGILVQINSKGNKHPTIEFLNLLM